MLIPFETATTTTIRPFTASLNILNFLKNISNNNLHRVEHEEITKKIYNYIRSVSEYFIFSFRIKKNGFFLVSSLN